MLPLLKEEHLRSVAQICNLPYRGIAFRRRPTSSRDLELAGALPIANRRYSRVQLCATAQGTLNPYKGEGRGEEPPPQMKDSPSFAFIGRSFGVLGSI